MHIRDIFRILTVFHAADVDIDGRSGPSTTTCDSVFAIRQLYSSYTETIRKDLTGLWNERKPKSKSQRAHTHTHTNEVHVYIHVKKQSTDKYRK